MKKITHISVILLFLLAGSSIAKAQLEESTRQRWNHQLETYCYFMPDGFIFLPIYAFDRDWLHLEARYNYEDMNTFSAWFGYNFSGGDKFQYAFTPMLGGIVGNSYGLAAGLEMTFDFFGFEFYSESEHVFSLEDIRDDFFYNWTDLTYSPLDWFWFGLSAQRTKLYQTDLEVQRGLLVGGGYKWFGINAYLYNLGWDDPYVIVSLTITFPEE